MMLGDNDHYREVSERRVGEGGMMKTSSVAFPDFFFYF